MKNSSGAYNLSALTWLGYSLLPQSLFVRNEVPFQPLFDRWNQAVLSVSGAGQTATPSDQPAYLTDLQRTVENLMEKNRNHD